MTCPICHHKVVGKPHESPDDCVEMLSPRLAVTLRALKEAKRRPISDGIQPGAVRPPMRSLVPIPNLGNVPQLDVESIRALMFMWSMRKCFYCELLGPCSHREPEVDIAILAGMTRRANAEWEMGVAPCA